MPLDADRIRELVTAYYAAVSARDVDVIATLFAPEAVMRDPVGTPPLTNDAARRERYALIAAAFASFEMSAQDVIVAGDEAAARWTATGRTPAGKEVRFEGISTFAFEASGRISMMSAYFDMASLTAQVQG